MLKRMRSFLMLAMLMLAVGVNAQVTTSNMSGRVTSESEVVIGATVLAIHEPSGTRYGAITNVDGRFHLQGMRVGGPYKVEISYIGYQTAIYKGIYLQLGENYELNVNLKESSELLDEVVITAEQSIAKSGVATNVTERQITTLPTITRSITDFTKLSPYAGRNSTFAGRDGRYNYITIDGAALNNGFGLSTNNLPGGDAQPISLDAIEEISVNVSPFDVKYSNFTGASVNAVTKSGTNDFKGTLYTFQKPNGFNGNTIDGQEISGWDEKSTRSYGFTLGGPILKDKLFFFISGELEKSVMPGVLWRPSAEENAVGDSKAYISRTSIADLERVKNFVKSTYGYDPGTYKDFGNFSSDNYKLLARLDWNINMNHKLTARFNYVDSKNDQLLSSTSAVITRANPGRYSYSSIAFSNSNYKNHNVVASFAGELNSRFSNNIQNKLIATYTHIQDTRSYNGAPFPYIDIEKDGNQYMTLGTEVFTPNNNVINNVFNVTDNLNITLGNHYLTAGLSFERQFFKNQYLRGALGYYRYASVDDFVNQKQPKFYGLTYGYNNIDAPGAELAFGMGGIYAQDDWSITPNFKLSYGLRLDLPMYLNSLTGNNAILNEQFANGEKVDVSKWPKTQVLLSPRIGFNWDLLEDRSIVISGGTGLFTGLLPFVWFTNQPTGAGMIQNMLEIGNSKDATAPLPEDFKFYANYKDVIAKYPDLFPSEPASKLPGSIAFVDPDFKMPQVWRSNISADIKLPYDFHLNLGAMYTRDVYNVVQRNINLTDPTGVYEQGQPGRAYWKDTKVNKNTGTVIKLTNGDKKGYQYAFNVGLNKRFSHGVSGMINYTYTVAKDLTANPGSSAASTWQNSVAVNSLNEDVLANSLFSTPHRVIGSISYELSLSKYTKTTFSLFYNGFHMGRYSYIYNTDLNGDGNKSDLIYVPNSLEEMIPMFVDMTDKDGNVTYSGKEQATDFWNYVNNDSYLKSRKGKYVERNGSLMPWLNRFDFKIAQDFYARLGKRDYGIQVSLDILNVGNMFNDAFGSYKTCGLKSYDNLQILNTKNKPGEPIRYQVNAKSHENWESQTEWYNTATVSNAWSMQIGVKLIF